MDVLAWAVFGVIAYCMVFGFLQDRYPTREHRVTNMLAALIVALAGPIGATAGYLVYLLRSGREGLVIQHTFMVIALGAMIAFLTGWWLGGLYGS